MSRTTKYKSIYFILIISSVGFVLFSILKFKDNYFVIVLLAVLFLIPGRVQGFLCRNFFTGRRLMTHKKFQDALLFFLEFDGELQDKKWLKYAIGLSGFVYTNSFNAMNKNNIGACYLESGVLNEAKKYFISALDIDSEYPIPFYNLSIVSEIEGKHDLAINQLNEAGRLGYARSTIDQVVSKAQEVYALIEGRKSKG